MIQRMDYACSPLNDDGSRALDAHTRQKVAIVGTSADPRRAPLDDPSFDVWGMNMSHGLFADREGRFRADRWFDLHEMVAQDAADHAWFAACPVPLYLPEADARYPRALRFPVEAAVRQGRDYFTCSMAYMVALALAVRYREIWIFGCDCLVGRELGVERACLSYWCGLAEGKGVRVVAETSEPFGLLRHPHRYGLDYTAEKEAVDRLMYRSLPGLLDAGQQPQFARKFEGWMREADEVSG